MLVGLLQAKAVIDYLYGEMQETQHLRTKKPIATEWEVCEAVHDVLRDPCTIVTHAQSQNSHWILFDALHSVAKLQRTMSAKLDAPMTTHVVDPDDGGEDAAT
jgi:hypothetical protein